MPGYDIKVKGEYARLDSLQCSACSLILKDAIQTEESGVRFCKTCWDDILIGSSSSKAEKAGVELSETTHPDIAVRREIDKLPVYCENHEYGCQWTGSLKDHEHDHKTKCEHKTEKCPLGCGLRLPLGRVARHVTDDCPCREVHCTHCSTITQARDFEDHLLSCPKAPYVCPHCELTMSRNEVEKHMFIDCTELLECVGCEMQIHRSTSKQDNAVIHLKDPEKVFVHFQKLGMKLNIMKAKHNEEIQHLRSQYQERIAQLEQSLLDAKASVNLEVKRLEERMEREPSNQVLVDMQEKVKALEEKLDRLPRGGGVSATSNQPYEELQPGDGRMMDTRIAEQERTAGMLKVHLSELELQLQASLASTDNGSFLWCIPDVRLRKRDAIDGKVTSIYSPPFYIGQNGYIMCIRAHGDGIGYDTHVSMIHDGSIYSLPFYTGILRKSKDDEEADVIKSKQRKRSHSSKDDGELDGVIKSKWRKQSHSNGGTAAVGLDTSEEETGIPKNILDKAPQFPHLYRIFINYADKYITIGVALEVSTLKELVDCAVPVQQKIFQVLNAWIDSNNDVKWQKILDVCCSYRNELGRAEAELREFLSSKEAHKIYLK